MSYHDTAREIMELAAAEPGGLDRLEAGDTAEAAAVVGHLAGCPACLEELGRLRRAEALLRPVLGATPDPALRERTLAYVRAVGVPREAGPAPAGRGPQAPRRRVIPVSAWAASLAAVLVIGLVAGSLLAGRTSPSGNADPAVALDAVARETAALVAAGDARTIALADASGAPLGSLVVSPAAGRIVVSAAGLPAPAQGEEYRCWVEVGGSRTALGSMWVAGDVAWWAGDVALPATLPPGVAYGVSLVGEGSSGPGTVVLTGEL